MSKRNENKVQKTGNGSNTDKSGIFAKISSFVKSVVREMKVVSWPTPADLKEGTAAVIIMSVIVAVYLSLTDALFGYLVRVLLIG